MTNLVTIAGGGASGLLFARALLERSSSVHVRIYEQNALGAGTAYSTRCPSHILNVPAERISAFQNAPDHFVSYLEQHHPGVYGRHSFAPRRIFGEYLTSIANETLARFASRFTHVRARLHDVAEDVDTLVLATGNELPVELPALRGAVQILNDPWNSTEIAMIPRNADVVIVGSGLTAIDVLLDLRANGHASKVRIVSRSGRLPHEHRTGSAIARVDATSLRALLASVRGAGRHWRTAIDGLRLNTDTIWQELSPREREQFRRHLAPFWNIHRHRMAPEIAVLLACERANETLSLHRSSLLASAALGEFEGAVVINATGSNQQLTRSRNTLLRMLCERGFIVPGPFGMGVKVDPRGAVIDKRGIPSTRLFALGPLRIGSLLETTAIPEIRQQAVTLASFLLEGPLAKDARPGCESRIL